MKKVALFLLFALSLVLPFMLFANGQSESKSAGPVTLTYILKSTTSPAPYKALFDAYKAKTGNTVQIQVLPESQNFDELMLTKFATHTYPNAFDADPGTKQYLKFRAQQNLYNWTNDPIVSKITSSMKAFQTLNGQIYGIPWGSTGNIGAYYNKKVFKALGVSVPQTYNQLLQILAKAKAAGYIPIYDAGKTGWPIQVFSLSGWTTYVDPAIGASGVAALNENKLSLADIPALRTLFQRQVDLYKMGYFQKDMLAGTYNQQQELFGEGKVAMIFQGAWILPPLAQKFGNSFVQNDVGWFPFPGNNGPGIATLYPAGQILVPKLAKNLKQTVSLVHFMVETKNLESWYKQRPGVPVYKDISVNLYPAEQTVIKFVNEGKSAINIQNRLSASFSQYVPILQNMLLSGNVTQALDQMEKEYVQSGTALGLPGF